MAKSYDLLAVDSYLEMLGLNGLRMWLIDYIVCGSKKAHDWKCVSLDNLWLYAVFIANSPTNAVSLLR